MDDRQMINNFMVETFHIIMKEEETQISKKFSNLSVKEMHVIDAVCRSVDSKGDNRVTTIAGILRVTAGTLTTAVSSLENKGYIERRRDGYDRRVVRLVPTKLGREAFAFHLEFHKHLVDKVYQLLEENEVPVLAKCLNAISQYFEKK